MAIVIKIKRLKPEAKIPSYAHPGDVGLDLYSLEDVTIKPGEHYRFYHGFALEFPAGFGALVKDKGSISKAGLHTMGGVFDAGYRGEYNSHLVNLSDKPYHFEKGDKVAQLIITPVEIAALEEASELSDSSRGTGAFGSTGKK
jgi:dUTP pyrophosphatase